MNWTHIHWASWSDFWAMGGYGFYVWGSKAMTFLLMALEMWQARQARQHTLNQLQHLMELDAHDTAAAHPHPGSAS